MSLESVDDFSGGGAGVASGCEEVGEDCTEGEFEDLTGHEPCVLVAGEGVGGDAEEDACMGQPG